MNVSILDITVETVQATPSTKRFAMVGQPDINLVVLIRFVPSISKPQLKAQVK